MSGPLDKESVRLAMDQAWRDHQHTRDQTWKALQFEIMIAAGVIGVSWQIESAAAILLGSLLVFVVALCGAMITKHHRNSVEITKFRHIRHCQHELALDTPDLIDGIGEPRTITIRDAFRWCEGNTALFIMRMHVAIMAFALLLFLWKAAQLIAK